MQTVVVALLLSLLISSCTIGYNYPVTKYRQYMGDRDLCIAEVSSAVPSAARESWNEFWSYYYGSELFCHESAPQ